MRDLLKQRSRIHRGFLAEPYDGIGQYVMVTMSRGSTAAAKLAKVASGDFGGGRRFPAGTPVTVFSIHGRLEVGLGNIPQPCDPFNRTVSDQPSGASWGKSPFGRWYGPDEYYRLHPTQVINPITGEFIAADAYQDTYVPEVVWNQRAFVEDGYAKLSYRISGTDYDVVGHDPTQLLPTKRLPKKVVIDFRTHPEDPVLENTLGIEFQLYFGRYHHWIWDEWAGLYILHGANDFVLDPFLGQQQAENDPWSSSSGSAYEDETPQDPEYVRAPHRLVVENEYPNEFRYKVWVPSMEAEPDWMAWTTFDAMHVPIDYFQVMYIEQINFATIGSGLRNEANQRLHETWFDRICVYY